MQISPINYNLYNRTNTPANSRINPVVKNNYDTYSASNKIPFKSIYSCKGFDRSTETIEILNKVKRFTPTEYFNLSEAEKNSLREIFTFPREYVQDTMTLFKNLNKKLNEKFPDGYTFVSIGRSPSLFAKMFNFIGQDAKICPISGLSFLGEDTTPVRMLSSHKVQKYGEFLKKIGLSKESVENAKTPFVFTDYTYKGTSLDNFEKILARDEIGIKGKNTTFLSLNFQLLDSSWYINHLVHKYLLHQDLKAYTSTPVLNYSDMDVVEEVLKKYREHQNAKLMNFHLIDNLVKEGFIKQ